jgi:hypothetical protein
MPKMPPLEGKGRLKFIYYHPTKGGKLLREKRVVQFYFKFALKFQTKTTLLHNKIVLSVGACPCLCGGIELTNQNFSFFSQSKSDNVEKKKKKKKVAEGMTAL